MKQTTNEMKSKKPQKLGFFAGLKSNRGTQLEELAEDMLGVMQALNRMEHQFAEFSANLSVLGGQLRGLVDSQSRAHEEIRRELTGERRAFALRTILEPVAGSLDSLELIRRGLDPATGTAFTQVSAAVAVLTNLIQSLGFARFEPALGERFDPNRMQCFGYAHGNPGEVVGRLQPGYMASGLVVRPAGVLLADPGKPAALPASGPAYPTS